MSYILDALQRAQSERERGAVPGLHSRNLGAPTPAHSQARWWPAALAIVLLVLALLAWLWWPSEQAVSAATPDQPAVLPAPQGPVRLHIEPDAQPAVQAASVSTVPAVPAPPAVPVAVVEGVPAELRASIPPLRITGSVYGKDPAGRLLLVNNLVLHQGETLSPGLTVELIEPQAALFNYQGTRFRIKY